MASAVLLAYSAKPFSIPEHQVQEQQSQQSQHIASILGGISMGLASCVCVGMAGKRMLDAVSSNSSNLTPRQKRMRNVLHDAGTDTDLGNSNDLNDSRGLNED